MGLGCHHGQPYSSNLEGGSNCNIAFNMIYIFYIFSFQIDIQNSCIFLPSKHITLSEPTANIPFNIRQCFHQHKLPSTLVIVCPSVCVHSAGHKRIDVTQEIPIKALEHSVSGWLWFTEGENNLQTNISNNTFVLSVKFS